MNTQVTLKLERLDVGQLLDGLIMRAESWKRTADYLRSGEMPEGQFFIAEDCHNSAEADDIADHYRAIIKKIRRQIKDQK